MKYCFKVTRNEEFDKQMKEVLENSQSATLRSLFTKLHFFKEKAEEICNHEMAMEALKIKMVFSSKKELY